MGGQLRPQSEVASGGAERILFASLFMRAPCISFGPSLALEKLLQTLAEFGDALRR